MSYFLLSTLLPWLVTLLIIGVILVIIINSKQIFKEGMKIPDKYKFLLFLSVIVGLMLRFYFTPSFHRIYFDEDRYLSYAVTFAKFNKALSVDVATPDKLVMGIPDDAGRVTVPVINGLVLKVFGYSENNLYQVAKILSSLQIILIFTLSLVLFKNYLTASLSSMAMAILPTNVYWSPSIGLDTFAVFFAMLTLIASVLYARKPNPKNALFSVFSFFILLGVRIESFIFLPIILFAIYAIRRDEKKIIISKNDLFFMILLLSFVIFRGLLSISVIGQKWCCAEALPLEAFAPNYFIRNLLPNIFHFFTKPEFPFTITILAIIALVGERGKAKFILGLWFLAYFVLYSTYYAGNFFTFEFSGSYGRYFLMLIPPTLILASLMATRIFERFRQKKILLIVLSFILISFIPTITKYKTLISTSPYFSTVEIGPKILHEFLENGVLKNTPEDSIIIHTLTGSVLLSGRSVVFIGYFFDRDEAINFVEKSLKENKRVYLFETYQCELFPKRCDKINKKFKFSRMNLKEGQAIGLDLTRVELKEASSSAKN